MTFATSSQRAVTLTFRSGAAVESSTVPTRIDVSGPAFQPWQTRETVSANGVTARSATTVSPRVTSTLRDAVRASARSLNSVSDATSVYFPGTTGVNTNAPDASVFVASYVPSSFTITPARGLAVPFSTT